MINILLCSVMLKRAELFLCNKMSKTMIYVKHSFSRSELPRVIKKKRRRRGRFFFFFF